jgi:hypothetical protein
MRTRALLCGGILLALGTLLGWLATSTMAQARKPQAGAKADPPLTPAHLAKRTLHRRAVEAVIWGMPAVNYDLMYQAMVRRASRRLTSPVP